MWRQKIKPHMAWVQNLLVHFWMVGRHHAFELQPCESHWDARRVSVWCHAVGGLWWVWCWRWCWWWWWCWCWWCHLIASKQAYPSYTWWSVNMNVLRHTHCVTRQKRYHRASVWLFQWTIGQKLRRYCTCCFFTSHAIICFSKINVLLVTHTVERSSRLHQQGQGRT